jgi:hypothetical protein
VKEISLINEVVAPPIAAELSARGGELFSGGFAVVAPERHNMPNDPEMSQRTIISPCTRRMSERMTPGSAGLSRSRVEAEQDAKKMKNPDRFTSSKAIRGAWT